MPVRDIATSVGESYRYEWDNGDDRFGFEGELLESLPPFRAVTTERMIGMPGAGTINEMTLTSVADGTLLSILITHPNSEVRDTVMATGMTDGPSAGDTRADADQTA